MLNEGILYKKYNLTRQHSNEKRKQKVIVKGEKFKPVLKPPVHQVYKFADRHKFFKVREQQDDESELDDNASDLKQQKKRTSNTQSG